MSNQSGYSATVQDMWSPLCYLETRNPNESKCGAESAALKFTNEAGCRFVIAHHEGPITRLETEQTFQVDANSSGANDTTGIQMTAHNGNVSITSSKNSIGIKAAHTITLEADSIIIKAKKKLALGGTESNYCRHIQIEGMLPGSCGLIQCHRATALYQTSFGCFQGHHSMTRQRAVGIR